MFAPFSEADPHTLEALAAISLRRTLEAEVVVVRQGALDSTVYCVVDGLLQTTVHGSDGREIVLSMLQPGQLFGEVTLFDPAPRSATVATLRRSELIALPGDALLNAVRQQPDICLKMVAALARRVRRLTEHVEELSALPIQVRLARKLLELSDLCGTTLSHNQVALPPGLSQQQLANHVQATRESVNKNLATWMREGILQRSSSQLVLCDRERLVALARGPLRAAQH